MRDIYKEFEDVCDELTNLQIEKVREYGEDRYNITDIAFEVLMCYSDSYRKHIRLKKLTDDLYFRLARRTCRGDEDYIEVMTGEAARLRDTYLEMASYAIMAVQQLDYSLLKEKERSDESEV